jgi:hypothetical protein
VSKTNPLASLARVFSPLIDSFYIFGQLFSDLPSENTELLASLASVLKNVSTPLQMVTLSSLTDDSASIKPLNAFKCAHPSPLNRPQECDSTAMVCAFANFSIVFSPAKLKKVFVLSFQDWSLQRLDKDDPAELRVSLIVREAGVNLLFYFFSF